MGKLITKTHSKGVPFTPQKGEKLVKSLSDSEIERRAKADPDALPLTGEQLARFRKVTHSR
jgi:hypothetical protein